MPAGFDLKLRDDAIARVRVSIQLDTSSARDMGAEPREDRVRNLENLLCGLFAGSINEDLVNAKILALWSTDAFEKSPITQESR